MNNLDLFKLSFSNLFRRKSRTFLTIVSVVIGAVSIILMLSIGFGYQRQQKQFIDSTGAFNTINIYSTNYYDPNSSDSIPTNGIITDEILKKIMNMEHVESVVPVENIQDHQFKFKNKSYSYWSNIRVFPKEFLTEDIKTTSGRSLSDLKKGEYVVGENVQVEKVNNSRKEYEVIPDFDWEKEKVFFSIGYDDLAMKLSGDTSGKTYEEYKLKFAGKVANSNMLDANSIYVSRETRDDLEKIQEKINKNLNPEENTKKKKNKNIRIYNDANITVDNLDNVEQVLLNIKDEFKIEGYSNNDLIKGQQQQISIVQTVFGGIGSIALIVAAIGIANTMLMSIQERTKEIGVMKVIGAQIKDIRKMFLFESMEISVIGGIIGLIISFISSKIINNIYLTKYANPINPYQVQGISYIPLWLPIMVLIFSAIIGLISGYLPAKKATKLSAIDAIRTA